MPGSTILAIDAGTHSVRAVLLNQQNEVLFTATEKLDLYRHTHQQVEQNPEAIVNATRAVIAKAINQKTTIIAAGLATQRSTVVAWNKSSGQSLGPALSWQDTRCADTLKQLHQHAEDIKARSGLILSPHYGASKLRWLLDQYATTNNTLDNNALGAGPLVSFLLYHLLETQPYITDESNAARTQLWNLQQRCWDKNLSTLFNVPVSVLPQCHPTQHRYGVIKDSHIPLNAVSGDQNAALLGVGTLPDKTALINIGTGAFILMPLQKPLHHPRLLTGLVQSNADTADYMLEATVNGAGAALRWLAEHRQTDQLVNDLPNWLASTENPPVFLNTIGGLGSPWWTSKITPAFLNSADSDASLTLQAVAIIESIVFMLAHNLYLIETALSLKLEQCIVSGGLAKLDGLCQKLANLAGTQIKRPAYAETTAIGIAQLTGKMEEYTLNIEKTFSPMADPGLEQRFADFKNGITKRLPKHF